MRRHIIIMPRTHKVEYGDFQTPTWNYLLKYADILNKRKSSMYKNNHDLPYLESERIVLPPGR
jgi:hypothetical protein